MKYSCCCMKIGDMFLYTIAYMVVCLGISRSNCNVTVHEAFTYLNELYKNESASGCGTPIKCDYTGDGQYYVNSSEVGRGFPCCYDCDACAGTQCYMGWQCCKGGPNDYALTDAGMYDVNTSCESTFTFEKLSYRGHVYETNSKGTTLPGKIQQLSKTTHLSYQMITSCPREYSDDKVMHMCETKEGIHGRILDLLPYFNLKTYLVYSNLYCVKCNAATNGSVPFSLIFYKLRLFTYYKTSFDSYILSANDLIELRISNLPLEDEDFAHFTLTALPEHLGLDNKHLPTPCGIGMGIKSSVCKDPSHASVLKTVCELFYFPIQIKEAGRGHMLHNLACGHCVFPNGFDSVSSRFIDRNIYGGLPQCSTESKSRSGLVFNISPAISMRSKGFQPEFDDVLHIELNPSGKDIPCDKGYFLDPYKGICRKILCPRHQYIYGGKCETLFKVSIGLSFYFKLKLTSSHYIDLDRDRSFVDELVLNITYSVTRFTGYRLCGSKVSVKTEHKFILKYIILELWLMPLGEKLYEDILSSFKRVIDGSFRKILEFHQTLPNYMSIDPGDTAFIDRGYKNAPLLDGIDGRRLIPLDGRHFIPSMGCGETISMTKQDFCNRMILNREEFHVTYLDTKRIINLLHIELPNVYVLRDNFEVFHNETIVIICIQDYLNGSSMKNTVDYVDNKDKDGIPNDSETERESTPELYIYIGLLVMAVIVAAAIIYCRVDNKQGHVQQN